MCEINTWLLIKKKKKFGIDPEALRGTGGEGILWNANFWFYSDKHWLQTSDIWSDW